MTETANRYGFLLLGPLRPQRPSLKDPCKLLSLACAPRRMRCSNLSVRAASTRYSIAMSSLIRSTVSAGVV